MADDTEQPNPGSPAGGFSWGLVPSSKAADAAKPAEPAEPAEPVSDEADDDLSTQAMSVADVAEVQAPLPEPERPPAPELTQPMTVQEVAAVQAPLAYSPPPPISPNTASVAASAAAAAASASDTPASTDPEPTSALDAVFRADQFREHDDAAALPVLPVNVAPPAGRVDRRAARSAMPAELPQKQKMLLWIVGSIVGVLVLIGLFSLGIRLGEQAAMNATGGETTAPVTPDDAGQEPVDTSAGPVAAGDHAWSDLLGGECLQPFDTAWAEEFTVVDCETDHVAQLLVRAEFDAAEDVAFPGVEALQSQVNLLCTDPAVLSYSRAGAVDDIRVSASFPADDTDWDAGNRTYFCFAERASGESLPGSIAQSDD